MPKLNENYLNLKESYLFQKLHIALTIISLPILTKKLFVSVLAM